MANNLDAAIYDLLLAGTTLASHLLQEQPTVPVNITAIAGSETDFLALVPPGHYDVRSLRLATDNPAANLIYVRLYELLNGFLTNVDTFEIDSTNYGVFFSLMDLFGLNHLAGASLRVTVQSSAGGPLLCHRPV